MIEVHVATGNVMKMQIAKQILADFSIVPKQIMLDIPEIQHENSQEIVRDKIQKAYEQLQKPVIISDDSWAIPGLNGWPGPYMKSMNEWLSAEDFLRLTLPLADRRVILQQHLALQDHRGQKLFRVDIEGTLTKEVRGQNRKSPCLTIISLTGDGRTVAEVESAGEPILGNRRSAWHELGEWLSNQPAY